MTPKEKAEELVNKFFIQEMKYYNNLYTAKECALLAVNEIINCDYFFKSFEDTKQFTKYWYEVQKEIEKL